LDLISPKLVPSGNRPMQRTADRARYPELPADSDDEDGGYLYPVLVESFKYKVGVRRVPGGTTHFAKPYVVSRRTAVTTQWRPPSGTTWARLLHVGTYTEQASRQAGSVYVPTPHRRAEAT
jgi:hypothetical protein